MLTVLWNIHYGCETIRLNRDTELAQSSVQIINLKCKSKLNVHSLNSSLRACKFLKYFFQNELKSLKN